MKILILLISLGFAANSFAIDCYLTVVKDNCWKNFQVTVKMKDPQTRKVFKTIKVSSKEMWHREKFKCTPNQNIFYAAKFLPIIWEANQDKEYLARRYWRLPATFAKDDKAWNINLCFSKDFTGVPLPPRSSGKCSCDFKSVPPLQDKS